MFRIIGCIRNDKFLIAEVAFPVIFSYLIIFKSISGSSHLLLISLTSFINSSTPISSSPFSTGMHRNASFTFIVGITYLVDAGSGWLIYSNSHCKLLNCSGISDLILFLLFLWLSPRIGLRSPWIERFSLGSSPNLSVPCTSFFIS